MNLLNIEHISKIYGEKIIFDDASFGVQEGSTGPARRLFCG